MKSQLSIDTSGLPSSIADWIKSLVEGEPSAKEARMRSDSSHEDGEASRDDQDYLRRAADCYGKAGWSAEASRLFELIDDGRRAADNHKAMGNWYEAAEQYVGIGAEIEAAACFLEISMFHEAAECYLRAEQPLPAAWILAERAGDFDRVITILDQHTPRSDYERLEVELVLCRCHANNPGAGKRLHDSMASLAQLPASSNRSRLFSWALRLGECVDRPDLVAQIHATAFTVGNPGCREQWEDWAIEVLQDAAGVPPRARGQIVSSKD